MRHFAKYSLLVIKQWESWVGIVALVLFAASRFRGHELPIPDWIWLAILAGLLYYATFEVYLAALKNVPKPGEIKLALKSVETGGGGSWSGGIPPMRSPNRCSNRLDQPSIRGGSLGRLSRRTLRAWRRQSELRSRTIAVHRSEWRRQDSFALGDPGESLKTAVSGCTD